MKTYIGIDNGVTGTIGIINPDGSHMQLVPVRTEQSYTKEKQNITRINVNELEDLFDGFCEFKCSFAVVERPMINATRFKASISAARALEATLNTLERLGIPYQYIDSREWQKALLPQGIKGAPELKKASLDIGRRLFPHIVGKFKDYDGLLIAEYAKRKGF